MKKMLAWFKSWFALAHVSRQLSALDRRVDDYESVKEGAARKLEWREKRFELLEGKLDSFEARIRSEVTAAKTDLKNAMKVQESLEEGLRFARSEIAVKDEQISMLVACNRAVLERVDRIAAEEVRKRVGATLPREEEDYGRI